VFESKDIKTGWDGTYNGSKLNSGVFAYVANVKFIDGSSTQLKGNVMLKK
jgi:hypothetical protein